MSERKKSKEGAVAAPSPGPARLFALLAGALLALLGVVGFFYDASFGTGANLASDDLAGLLNVNGWRNVVYLATGLLALGFASRAPRSTALGLGAFYLTYAIWGFSETERGIGSILDTLPMGNNDNALHLSLGILGLGAALIDGPLPKVPERFRPKRDKRDPKKRKLNLSKMKLPKLPKRKKPATTGERESRRRSPAGPRRGDAA